MSIQREAWLGQNVEEAIDPGLPICDPHHHFWDREGDRYLLDQLTQDLGGGHNVAQTVFIECHSMYRAKGPEEMRAVGETEFVQGISAQSASGQYGSTEVAAGIIANANLMLGDAVAPVLEGHVPPAPTGSAGYGSRAPGTPAPKSQPDVPAHRGCSATRLSAPGSTACSAWGSASTRWCTTLSLANWPTWPERSPTPS